LGEGPVAGIDIGSRTVKLALLAGGQLLATRVEYSNHDPLAVCRLMLDGYAGVPTVATGYGRRLFREHWPCEVITEIRAAALGARFLHPRTRTVLDIGGQDTKVVALDGDGAVRKFEMNDRCAAGTGRFLEVMATALSFSMPEFVAAADRAGGTLKLGSMCTVFAESEVVSAVARGHSRAELALGIHRAIADRTAAMLRRLPLEDDVLFCGGGAHNACLRRLVGEQLGRGVHVPADPQVVAAVGCALHAAGSTGRSEGAG
jgi:(R)-2-hydroxyacyl-CoA dehydratese activating ATPase